MEARDEYLVACGAARHAAKRNAVAKHFGKAKARARQPSGILEVQEFNHPVPLSPPIVLTSYQLYAALAAEADNKELSDD